MPACIELSQSDRQLWWMMFGVGKKRMNHDRIIKTQCIWLGTCQQLPKLDLTAIPSYCLSVTVRDVGVMLEQELAFSHPLPLPLLVVPAQHHLPYAYFHCHCYSCSLLCHNLTTAANSMLVFWPDGIGMPGSGYALAATHLIEGIPRPGHVSGFMLDIHSFIMEIYMAP